MENQQALFTPGWNDPPPTVAPTTGINRLQRHKRLVDPSITGYGNGGNNFSSYQQQQAPQFNQTVNPHVNPHQSFSTVPSSQMNHADNGNKIPPYQQIPQQVPTIGQQPAPQQAPTIGQQPNSAFTPVPQQHNPQFNQPVNPHFSQSFSAPHFGQQHYPETQQRFPQHPY